MTLSKVVRKGSYQGVAQWGISTSSEITPSRKTARKWAELENARTQIPTLPTARILPPDPSALRSFVSSAELILFHFEETDGEAPYGGISEEQLTNLHEQNLADLLCNFGHWCDRNGIDMQDVIRRAAGHYMTETDNKGVQFTTHI